MFFKTTANAHFTTLFYWKQLKSREKTTELTQCHYENIDLVTKQSRKFNNKPVEREMGFEPTTLSLGS